MKLDYLSLYLISQGLFREAEPLGDYHVSIELYIYLSSIYYL